MQCPSGHDPIPRFPALISFCEPRLPLPSRHSRQIPSSRPFRFSSEKRSARLSFAPLAPRHMAGSSHPRFTSLRGRPSRTILPAFTSRGIPGPVPPGGPAAWNALAAGFTTSVTNRFNMTIGQPGGRLNQYDGQRHTFAGSFSRGTNCGSPARRCPAGSRQTTPQRAYFVRSTARSRAGPGLRTQLCSPRSVPAAMLGSRRPDPAAWRKAIRGNPKIQGWARRIPGGFFPAAAMLSGRSGRPGIHRGGPWP